MKNAFFWGIACWNSSKITKFGNFHSFLAIFDRFLIFANFFVIFGKKILKRGQINWNWCQLLGEHDFWAKIGSRAKIDRGVAAITWQGFQTLPLLGLRVVVCPELGILLKVSWIRKSGLGLGFNWVSSKLTNFYFHISKWKINHWLYKDVLLWTKALQH